MPLREHFEQTGNRLFGWRSYLPAVLVVLVLATMRDFHYLGGRHEYQEMWAALCIGVSLAGLLVRALVVGHAPRRTSGRNTAEQIADALNTTGMYSIVRHPLYLGNFLIWLGIALFALKWWLSLIYGLLFCLYYERIMFAEEEFLRRRFGDEFVRWAAVTPAIVPRLRLWRKPHLAFSPRNVLRREYTALLGIFAAFAGLEMLEHVVVEHRFVAEPHWLWLGGAALAIAVLLRFLKRHTRMLTVEGR